MVRCLLLAIANKSFSPRCNVCGNAFVSSGATAAHMKAVHKILGPRAKPFEDCKVRDTYSVFESFEDNAAQEQQLPPVCPMADSRNLVPISLGTI